MTLCAVNGFRFGIGLSVNYYLTSITSRTIYEQSSGKVVATSCPPNIWQLFSGPWRQSSPFNLYKLISDDLSGNDLLSSLISSLFSSRSMLSALPSNQFDEIIHTKLPMAGIANTYLSRNVDLQLVPRQGWIIGLVFNSRKLRRPSLLSRGIHRH